MSSHWQYARDCCYYGLLLKEDVFGCARISSSTFEEVAYLVYSIASCSDSRCRTFMMVFSVCRNYLGNSNQSVLPIPPSELMQTIPQILHEARIFGLISRERIFFLSCQLWFSPKCHIFAIFFSSLFRQLVIPSVYLTPRTLTVHSWDSNNAPLRRQQNANQAKWPCKLTLLLLPHFQNVWKLHFPKWLISHANNEHIPISWCHTQPIMTHSFSRNVL